MGSDALLSSSPSLIWLQLGFGLARAATIYMMGIFQTGPLALKQEVLTISHESTELISIMMSISYVKTLRTYEFCPIS